MLKQRETRRIKTKLSCNWGVTEDCPRSGTITSLSVQGCFVQTKAAVNEDQPLFLNCWLPSQRWLPLRGRIVYHLPRVGFGLIFTDLSDNDQEMVNLLLDFYEEQQAPADAAQKEDDRQPE